VVTFGAFVEILPGVEGLVHISELAQHHVENPREVVSQGDDVKVLILEIDAERRRLSLSLKRVEEGMQVQPRIGDEPAPPALGLSEEVFAEPAATADEDVLVTGEEGAEAAVEPLVVDEPEAEAAVEPEAEAAVEPEAEAAVESEVEAALEPEAEAAVEPEAEAAPEVEAEADDEAAPSAAEDDESA